MGLYDQILGRAEVEGNGIREAWESRWAAGREREGKVLYLVTRNFHSDFNGVKGDLMEVDPSSAQKVNAYYKSRGGDVLVPATKEAIAEAIKAGKVTMPGKAKPETDASAVTPSNGLGERKGLGGLPPESDDDDANESAAKGKGLNNAVTTGKTPEAGHKGHK